MPFKIFFLMKIIEKINSNKKKQVKKNKKKTKKLDYNKKTTKSILSINKKKLKNI